MTSGGRAGEIVVYIVPDEQHFRDVALRGAGQFAEEHRSRLAHADRGADPHAVAQ